MNHPPAQPAVNLVVKRGGIRMRNLQAKIWMIFLATLLAQSAFPHRSPAPKLINPENDLTYLGAFRLPNETSTGTSWSYGGTGMSFYPGGVPQGGDDGFPGSLFAVGHPHQNLVSGFDIPAPVISSQKKVEDLPTARSLFPFVDVTNGQLISTGDTVSLGDIQFMPLPGAETNHGVYWIRYIYYLPPNDYKSMGWWGYDSGQLVTRGPWRIGKFNSAATSKYLFDIPPQWAEVFAGGRSLAAGQYRINNGGSWGPALYATAPWKNGKLPAANEDVQAIELLSYDDSHTVVEFSHSDEWSDGAWLSTGEKCAVIFAGTKAIRTVSEGTEYYGEPGPDGCRAKGYQGEPYYGCILFYNPADFEAVAQGNMRAYKPQPYVKLQVENYLYKATEHCKHSILGGVAFDRQNRLLYVMERFVEGLYDRKPIVHVWRVDDSGQEPDREPPSAPAGMTVEAQSSSRIDISWKPSTDSSKNILYLVYRNNIPVALTTSTFFSDEKFTSFNASDYRYKVEARDAVNNRSKPSPELIVSPGSRPVPKK